MIMTKQKLLQLGIWQKWIQPERNTRDFYLKMPNPSFSENVNKPLCHIATQICQSDCKKRAPNTKYRSKSLVTPALNEENMLFLKILMPLSYHDIFSLHVVQCKQIRNKTCTWVTEYYLLMSEQSNNILKSENWY